MIKSEIESALRGNQWALSCFGAIKEKPNLPNFIEDQSFEEIRLLFYEAKANGTVQQTQMHVNSLMQDAKAKMQSCSTLSNDTILNIIRMYNNVATVSNKPNPFGIENNSGNISATREATIPNSSLFALPQIGNQTSQIQTNNIFGATQSQSQVVTPQFGGGGGIGATAPQSTNIFASMNAQLSTSGNNIFANQAQQQQPPPPFGVAVAQSTQQSIFGQPIIQTQQQQSSNPFGSNVPATQQQQQPSSIFNTAATQQPSSVFNTAATQQPSSVFGAAPQMQTAAPVSSASPFQTKDYSATQHSTNIFGNTAQNFNGNSGGGGVGGGTNSMGNQGMSGGGGSVGGTSALTSPAGDALLMSDNSTVYSKMSDLTPDELQAFQSDHFVLGKIPIKPPPKELC